MWLWWLLAVGPRPLRDAVVGFLSVTFFEITQGFLFSHGITV
jgi:hypothetical protein